MLGIESLTGMISAYLWLQILWGRLPRTETKSSIHGINMSILLQLRNALNIIIDFPSYEIAVVCFVFSVFSPEVLDLTEYDLVGKFVIGVSMVTALSLAISFPTLAVAPHMFVNAYMNVLAVALATEYSFPQADEDPSKFVVAAVAGPAVAAGTAPDTAAAKEEEK
ncbi:60S acidic ribosomal protein P0-like [Lotus japonicus]|uniref:60S acidic ribosomal protein P0-like n=1 Tax=Lotus japonicus TaxID=34305 RepID=UPI002586E3AD|nr:60S acidic ribosomal protein P0-like [Lotus japonicus]